MDADLSRKAGWARNTPYWIYSKNQQGDRASDWEQEVIDTLVNAGTYGELEEGIKLFFDRCDRSVEIAESLGISDFYDSDNLNKILDKLFDEQAKDVSDAD